MWTTHVLDTLTVLAVATLRFLVAHVRGFGSWLCKKATLSANGCNGRIAVVQQTVSKLTSIELVTSTALVFLFVTNDAMICIFYYKYRGGRSPLND